MKIAGVGARLNTQEIIDYYDNCQIDYELAWHLKSKMSMHYGFWDDHTPNLRQALGNMNERLAAFAPINQGDYVLDAGCGVGGSSIFLAKKFDCHTQGITLSEKQVMTCRENAARHEVGDKCIFDAQSYLQTSFPDATFDVVWAIESVCHAPDKAEFLREAFRVLKPGGRLVLADFFGNSKKQDPNDIALMQQWADTWAVCSYAVDTDFLHSLQATGFEAIRSVDVSRNVEKSVKRLLHDFMIGLPIDFVLRLLRIRNKLQNANLWSAYYQYKTYKKDLWRYMFFAAQKPMR